MRLALASLAILLLTAAKPASDALEAFQVRESLSSIAVDTHAPYPPEIENETQARALAKEAAVVLGQNEILRHILRKRTRKGITLEQAQVPSTALQDDIKAFIAGSRVSGVRFDETGCRLRVSVQKANLKVILRKG
jgi:hypothetical protein